MTHNDSLYWSALISLKTLKCSLLRAKEVPDPATRATLMLEKLLVFTDLIQSVAETAVEFAMDNMSDDAKNKEVLTKQIQTVREEASNSMKLLNEELKVLCKWIQNPCYSPDHLFGHSVMKETEQKFNDMFEINTLK
jgi:hypothetical protein